MSELNTPAALVVWGGFVLAFLFINDPSYRGYRYCSVGFFLESA